MSVQESGSYFTKQLCADVKKGLEESLQAPLQVLSGPSLATLTPTLSLRCSVWCC